MNRRAARRFPSAPIALAASLAAIAACTSVELIDDSKVRSGEEDPFGRACPSAATLDCPGASSGDGDASVGPIATGGCPGGAEAAEPLARRFDGDIPAGCVLVVPGELDGGRCGILGVCRCSGSPATLACR